MTDAHFWNNTTVRQVERNSIRTFVQSCAEHLTGRVLDYGCGKQPYREIVEEAGGRYTPFDRKALPGNVSGEDIGPDGPLALSAAPWDAILCNQVIQYVQDPRSLIRAFRRSIWRHGHLVLTYPTTWPEVEPVDLFRFTKAGMSLLLEAEGFTIDRHEQRASIDLSGFRLPLGYGCLAHA